MQINHHDWSSVTSDKVVVTSPIFLHGHACSCDDSKRIVITYAMWIVLLQDCATELDYYFYGRGPHPDRGFKRTFSGERCYSLYNAIRSDDAGDVIDQIKAALLVLRHLPTKQGKIGPSAAKRRLRQIETEFAFMRTGTVWEILHPILLAVLESQSTYVFRIANDLIQFFVRLTLRDCDWIYDDALTEYKEREISLKENYYDPHFIKELRNQITEWFQDFDWSKAIGSHGYGATFGVPRSEGTAAKYNDMYPTVETARFADLIQWRPLGHVWPGLSQAYSYILELGQAALRADDFISKVQFVPKAFDKPRVVSMEPTTHMFYQKAIFLAMDAHFEKHPEIRVSLHDQWKNQVMALKGSVDGSYATIDLSAASDTVTQTLVREVLKDTPLYYPCCYYTRTVRTMLPDGDVVELEKFAPMGSACCFPVECLIFSAIAAVACKRVGIKPDYRVYGDDIVVPRAAYNATLFMLELCNFEPNMTKSYGNGSLFTESCGIECWKGCDVSPLRLSRKFDPLAILRTRLRRRPDGTFVKPRNLGALTQLDGLYKLGNACYDHGYYELRKLCIRLAQNSFLEPVFSHNFENGFFSPDPQINMRKKRRVVSAGEGNLGRVYIQTIEIGSTIAPGPDDLRYSKAIEDLLEPNRHLCEKASVGPASTSFRLGWTPAELLDLWYYDPSYVEVVRSYRTPKTFRSYTDRSVQAERRTIMRNSHKNQIRIPVRYAGDYMYDMQSNDFLPYAKDMRFRKIENHHYPHFADMKNIYVVAGPKDLIWPDNSALSLSMEARDDVAAVVDELFGRFYGRDYVFSNGVHIEAYTCAAWRAMQLNESVEKTSPSPFSSFTKIEDEELVADLVGNLDRHLTRIHWVVDLTTKTVSAGPLPKVCKQGKYLGLLQLPTIESVNRLLV